MKQVLFVFWLALWPVVASAQNGAPALEDEIRRIDAAAATPDGKAAVLGAMAERLHVHPNHLILLRKESGQSYGRIFASELGKKGDTPEQAAAEAHALNGEIAAKTAANSSENTGIQPLLSVSTFVDHSYAGTFYSVTPEAGIRGSHAAVVFGAPYYRGSGTGVASGGMGDAYLSGSVYGYAGQVDLASSLTITLPTGDEAAGLGTGETGYDISGTVGRQFGAARPFLNAGFTNSIGNTGYVRPYAVHGNAAHATAGLELRAGKRVTFDATGFVVRPQGDQTVYSRLVSSDSTATTTNSTTATSTTATGNMMTAHGNPSHPNQGRRPVRANGAPGMFEGETIVPASDVADHGFSGGVRVKLAPAVSLRFEAARSIPFQFTIVRAGLEFNLGRMLFPGRAW